MLTYDVRCMAVTVRVEHFDGPLDLLLQLVEQEKLDISSISLAAVAEQFVQHIRNHPEIPPQELADYLVIAAKLIYLKSKLLVPSFYDEELEDGPDLETQLREYRRFVGASRELQALWMGRRHMFSRPVALRRADGFHAPSGLTIETLHEAMRRCIARLEPVMKLPNIQVRRVVSLQEKIRDLLSRLGTKAAVTFRDFCQGLTDRRDAVVSFLALLELTKQHHVQVEQAGVFHDIQMKANPDAPRGAPITTDTYL